MCQPQGCFALLHEGGSGTNATTRQLGASSAPTSSLPILEAVAGVPFGRAPLMLALEVDIFLTACLLQRRADRADEEGRWLLLLQRLTHL